MANLTLGLQPLQRLKQVVRFQDVDPGVMRLIEVDIVGIEAAQALLAGKADKVRVEFLRPFLMSNAGSKRIVEVIAELGGDDHLVAAVAEDFSQDFLAIALAVGIGGIEKVDARLQGIFQERGPLLLGNLAPPGSSHGPNAEAHLGKREFGTGKRSVFHSYLSFLRLWVVRLGDWQLGRRIQKLSDEHSARRTELFVNSNKYEKVSDTRWIHCAPAILSKCPG